MAASLSDASASAALPLTLPLTQPPINAAAEPVSSGVPSPSPSPSCVSVRYLDGRRGVGLVTTRSVKKGEVLFRESPCALFQANAALVPTCSSTRCMRVMGSVKSLASRGYDMWRQVTGQEVQRGDEAERKRWDERAEATQKLLKHLPPDDDIAPCRASRPETPCTERYCSHQCESDAWTSGHVLLCPSLHGSTISAFLTHRNVARNGDAMVAARMMAGFFCEVASLSTRQIPNAPPPLSSNVATSALGSADVAKVWARWSCFHADGWSTVLAVQALEQAGIVCNERVLDAHRDEVRKRNGKDVTWGTTADDQHDVASSANSATPLLSTDSEALASLNSTQQQYRRALDDAFTALHRAWTSLTPPHSSSDTLLESIISTREHWLPFITPTHFDLLAGAQRLNCTLTQTALPIPRVGSKLITEAESKTTSGPVRNENATSEQGASALNLFNATEETVAAALATSSASSARSSSSSSSSPPFLFSSLLPLFIPMSLPLGNAKALFRCHSKMNHSCRPNARVENWTEEESIEEKIIPEGKQVEAVTIEVNAVSAASATTTLSIIPVPAFIPSSCPSFIPDRSIPWGQRSMHLAHQLYQERQSRFEQTASGGGGNKKKKAKKKKKANEERRILEEAERKEIDMLHCIAKEMSGHASNATPPTSSSPTPSCPVTADSISTSTSSSAAVPTVSERPLPLPLPLPLSATNLLIVRALRDLDEGEEICISYMPPTQGAGGGADVDSLEGRRAYLRKHYLFHCRCTKCVEQEGSTLD